MNYILLLVGFLLLVKGADFFVDGSASLAKILKVPSIIIGLTVVAFGTSLPESSVSLLAIINGSSGIATGNIVGSNIFNMFAIIGICSIFVSLDIDKNVLYKDFLYSIFLTILALIFAFSNYKISNFEGLILLFFFVLYLIYTIKSAKKNQKKEEDYKEISIPLSLFYIIIGIVGIIFGGKFVVDSASKIASYFKISDTVIGLSVVAVGTSLPELVTSFIASKKNETDIAIGNVIGSNIFNIALILGSSASILEIKIDILSIYDFIFLIVGSVIFFILLKNGKTKRLHGFIFIIIYIIYNAYIILR